MENSKAYAYLVDQLGADFKKLDDEINEKAFDDLLPEEIEYIEQRIVNSFKGKDGNYKWAKIMPRLHFYNGIEILKETLQEKNIPSKDSIYIATVLLISTGEKEFIKIIEDNIRFSKERKKDYVYIIAHNKSDLLLPLLEQIYINDGDENIRCVAIEGILYSLGLIKNIDDLKEYIDKRDYINEFLM